MAIDVIFENVKKSWDELNVRGFLILSLSLQIFLVVFSPFRKKTANTWMSFLIWSAYLIVDWAAAFAVGLIFNSQGENNSAFADAGSLSAFWAPFQLLHLGVQLSAAVYIFLRALPKDRLLVPTIVMFIAGVIKYLERTRALHLARLDRFKESVLLEPDMYPLPPTRREVAIDIDGIAEEALGEKVLLWNSYCYFEVFKGLIVDQSFTLGESIVICALTLFVRVDKHGFHHVDVLITYMLLFGAVALDVMSLLMLIFSEWTVAEYLQELKRDKWRVMSWAWVEMLSHAAIRSRADIHAQALSRDGELITLVWILLAHFGIGESDYDI
ncbi:hypothetical protein CRG98_021084 [Punica granatum]|uniref:DUF4220 domain-containing protein n=1 Tax=Punica granatum TaxID=22663 RepID=A0A2I0JRJ9_PUNGR|nr:hypothetical protein CRG98_021084 [Punica granatum]